MMKVKNLSTRVAFIIYLEKASVSDCSSQNTTGATFAYIDVRETPNCPLCSLNGPINSTILPSALP